MKGEGGGGGGGGGGGIIKRPCRVSLYFYLYSSFCEQTSKLCFLHRICKSYKT